MSHSRGSGPGRRRQEGTGRGSPRMATLARFSWIIHFGAVSAVGPSRSRDRPSAYTYVYAANIGAHVCTCGPLRRAHHPFHACHSFGPLPSRNVAKTRPTSPNTCRNKASRATVGLAAPFRALFTIFSSPPSRRYLSHSENGRPSQPAALKSTRNSVRGSRKGVGSSGIRWAKMRASPRLYFRSVNVTAIFRRGGKKWVSDVTPKIIALDVLRPPLT